MCQRNLTRRSIPATEIEIRRVLPLEALPDGSLSVNDTYQECYVISGGEEKIPIAYINKAWMGMAVPFGLLVGIVAALVVFRLCCKRYWKQVLRFFIPYSQK